MSFGWPEGLACYPSQRVAPVREDERLLAAPARPACPCRWPPTPAVPAIGCCTRLIYRGVGLSCQEPFPISSFTFVPDDEAEFTRGSAKHEAIRQRHNRVIHRTSQVKIQHGVARCTKRWKS